jgi:hypothetical protein
MFEIDEIRDPYNGVPLGAEAFVTIPQPAIYSERSHHDDQPAARTVPARNGWRG